MKRAPFTIVFLITDLETGGAEIMLYRLLAHLDREKFEPTVISLRRAGPLGEKICALNIPVLALGMDPDHPNPFAWFKLLRILKHIHPSLIQTWMYHSDLLGGLAGFIIRIPVIWGIHNSTTDPAHTRRRTLIIVRLCAFLSRLIPAKIISCSERACQVHVQAGYAREKFVIIPNGFDITEFKPDPDAAKNLRLQMGIEPTVSLIGMVARYDPQKDHANFIRAAQIYHQTSPQTHFLLCGEGLTWQNTSIGAEIDAAGLRSQFHLLGRRIDMPTVYPVLSLHGLSSAYGEAFPNALGEAMACGVPCFATDVGDCSFIIGDTGLVVPPKDSQALADAWEQILCLSAEERLTLGERARQRIQQLFSIAQVAWRYEELYEQVLQGNR
jgi:glycosyltransferase involved in cell wall biosynthesis